ncbi:dihydrodipicolinate synthase family protein [Nakamurella alba]|nr:dihydrodipicolinate synthase family protein [Nakamurella alba]
MPKLPERYAIVVAATPYGADGAVDEVAFRHQLGRLRDAGVAVNLVGPGIGEAFTLSDAERDRVLAIGVEELRGQVPVRAMGREPRTPDEMIRFVRRSEELGVDAVQVYSLDIGHGAKPSLAEMAAYYDAAISATSLPVYLSSHFFIGYTLPIELLVGLAERHQNFVGMNISVMDPKYLASAIRELGYRLEIHCAGVWNAVNVLSLGGTGLMGAEGNVAPRLFADVVRHFVAGDQQSLRTSFDQILGLWAAIDRFGGSVGRGLKPLMNALGLPGGSLRAPLLPIPDDDLDVLLADVKALKIPELQGMSEVIAR